MKPKIRIIACADNFHFIQDLIPALSDEFDIQTLNAGGQSAGIEAYNRLMLDCDLIWLEWADGFPVNVLDFASEYAALDRKKIILRLHRYELFTPRTLQNLELLSSECISRIDKLVFVSKTVQGIGIDKFPWMADSVVIPNLIDHTKFPFQDKEPGGNIMMLGRMSYVKNLPLALTMFNELTKIDQRYQLHIVGEISDPELVYYLENFIIKTGNKNIRHHGRIDNDKLPEFMKDMNFVICTSIFESQGMGILEAMCCGLKPVVFDFPGAEQTFPHNFRWIDFEQFKRIFEIEHDPILCHDFVVEQYGIEKNIFRYRELISEALNEKAQKERIQTDVF